MSESASNGVPAPNPFRDESISTPGTDGQERVPPNGIHNKLLEQVVRTPGRQPSPQPTHLNAPGPNQHKLLQEEGPGYVAPKFEGKDQQMEEGKKHVLIRWMS